MMSTAMHQYATPPFEHYQPSFGMMPQSNPYPLPPLPAHNSIASYSQSPQYPVQPIPQPGFNSESNSRKRSVSSRYGPYGDGTLGSTVGSSHISPTDGRTGSSLGGNAPVRRRISRACDQCNQLRTRCDGQSPCAHCVEFGLGCEYNRERKKRGKASRKDLQQQQQQQQAAAAAAANGESVSPSAMHAQSRSPTGSAQTFHASPETTPIQDLPAQGLTYSRSMSVGGPYATSGLMSQLATITRSGSVGNLYEASNSLEPPLPFSSRARNSPLSAPPEMRLNVFDEPEDYNRQSFQSEAENHVVPSVHPQGQFNGSYSMSGISQPYVSQEYTMISPHTQENQNNHYGQTVSGDVSSSGFVASVTPTTVPSWTPQIAASLSSAHPQTLKSSGADLRYPVLAPLLPYVDSILSTSVACDLLESYFAASSTSHVHPTSPNVLTSIFRQQSILAMSQPRTTSPALLASMLWVAAQTSEASMLTESADARANVCQKLLEVTLDLLNPLNHGLAHHDPLTNSSSRGLGLGSLVDPKLGSLTSTVEDPATLDDVVTYLHLATVLSNTGHGLMSSRWWTAAFTIAKELKLNTEVAARGVADVTDEDAEGEDDVDFAGNERILSEESKEERRRVWWLLFAMDRHIAFTYSHATFLAGSDCTELFQALDDEAWQSSGATSQNTASRKKGPSSECTGRGLLGYYLPLMVILGDIIDLKNARSHPRFAANSSASQYHLNCSSFIGRQLEAYNHSLRRVETRFTADAETANFIAHAKFTMHALHVLLVGKWDPNQLLADADKWKSTEAFSATLTHAVSAAEAFEPLLEQNARPFITGPFLLQVSWMLMLAADKFREGASSAVVGALDACVRAIENSTGLLRPDHQTSLAQLIRTAHATACGQQTSSKTEILRQREILRAYRWSGEGSGLAI